VHGTTITVLNAGRKYLGSADLAGKVRRSLSFLRFSASFSLSLLRVYLSHFPCFLFVLVVHPMKCPFSMRKIAHSLVIVLFVILQVFVTSGLGGMSGAQPKATVIAGAIGVVAEINRT